MRKTPARAARPASRQRGGFLTGLIVGLLIGLALSLGVALYVTKVPVPFLDKVPQRTQEQDAAEREKNKNWDPNAPLAGKNPARPASSAASASGAVTPPTGTRDPASILADRPAAGSAISAKASAPLSTGSVEEAFSYFVQTGAYASAEDAESQRGKLGLLGYAARVTEREQSGRTVHRVRLGPFEEKVEADSTKEKLLAAGFEAVLVRAPK
ncbi:MAG: SPOR domain-containing protein [Pseudomonadota bacterium]|jgi:cell division protein FtsN|nr:SPOR domain-containing protein [Pseudomonadota bacterium]